MTFRPRMLAVAGASVLLCSTSVFAGGPRAGMGVRTRPLVLETARAAATPAQFSQMKNPSLLVDAEVRASGGEAVGFVTAVAQTSDGLAHSVDVRLGSRGHGGARSVR